MKTALVFLALVAVALAGIELRGSVDVYSTRTEPEVQQMFKAFQVKYGKAYATGEEFNNRYNTFKASLVRIDARNKAAGPDGAKYGITKFSDMTTAEFKQLLGYKASATKKFAPVADKLPATATTSIDWRTKGAVTAVKDQGQCGSCWAFSATEGVESGYFMAKGKLNTLAPQQITSCDETDGGCNGGDLPTAFAYVKANGMETEQEYPYTSGGGDTGSCKYKKADVVAQITGFEYATKDKDENQMKSVTETKGPLSICVDAETWQDYDSGIVKSDCGTQLDHCVQLVGFNAEGSTPYWMIRNSWNTDWGMDGYIHVAIGKNLCGVAEEPTYVLA